MTLNYLIIIYVEKIIFLSQFVLSVINIYIYIYIYIYISLILYILINVKRNLKGFMWNFGKN